MGSRIALLFCLLFCLWMGIAACTPLTTPTQTQSTLPASPSRTLEPAGFVQRIHDPVMAKEGDTYYVFSTGSRIIVICSKDMLTWEWCGRVFESNPAWLVDAVPGVGDLWAPDISFFNGKWRLYYSGSTFGSNRSAIGLATNATLDKDSPDYAWVDEGLVIGSTPSDNWNTIDPNFVLDTAGQPWLTFGSFWSGLKMRKLDPQTGLLAKDDSTLYSLAANVQPGGPIEAPFIVRRGDYYYLFASYDQCCRGIDSTYNVRVGRSSAINGPYVDRDNRPLLEGGGTQLLSAYGQWRGPGHNGIYQDGEDFWIVYHAYDAQEIGTPKLRIELLGWDANDWPFLASQAK